MKYVIIIIVLILVISFFVIFKNFSFPAKIRKANEFLEDGNISRTNEIIKKILDKKRDYVPARYIRAQVLIKQNQYLLAISELLGILKLPDFDKFVQELQIHYHLAGLYSDTNNWQKEIEEYKIILTFNSDDLIANHRIGHALYKQKDYRKAKEHLLKAIIIDPSLKDIYLPLGISCYNISDYEKGEEYLTLSLKDQGDNSETQFYLGSIYKMKKYYDNSVQMFEKAKTSRRFFIKSLYSLGEIFYEQEMYQEAIESLEQGLNDLKGSSDENNAFRYLLAECYEHSNKIKEAAHHWEKIHADNPDFRSTKVKLDSYKEILKNDNLMTFFKSSLEELQPVIVEMISSLNHNIISKEKIDSNEYQYKAYNTKRINEPPILIYFNRTTREITEDEISKFHKKIGAEKCKSGIYITTSKFSLRAKSNVQSKMIELYDTEYVNRIIKKIQSRKKYNKKDLT